MFFFATDTYCTGRLAGTTDERWGTDNGSSLIMTNVVVCDVRVCENVIASGCDQQKTRPIKKHDCVERIQKNKNVYKQMREGNKNK